MQTDYQGWCSIDIISGRGDRKKALKTCVNLILKYHALAEKLLTKKRKSGKT